MPNYRITKIEEQRYIQDVEMHEYSLDDDIEDLAEMECEMDSWDPIIEQPNVRYTIEKI